eukprot:2887883-Rhodomonas_salina.1
MDGTRERADGARHAVVANAAPAGDGLRGQAGAPLPQRRPLCLQGPARYLLPTPCAVPGTHSAYCLRTPCVVPGTESAYCLRTPCVCGARY